MEASINNITVNGIEYVEKCSVSMPAKKLDDMEYKIVRSESAGVFAGYVAERSVTEAGVSVVMLKARRLWFWSGAASLSQLAMEGVKKPDECKFPCEVYRVEVFGVIEILDVTRVAQDSIASVPVWKA